MALLEGELREQILSSLHSSVDPGVFNTWCRGLVFDELEDGSIQIPVPNQYYREWVEREIRAPLEEAFRRHLGRLPVVAFSVRPEAVPKLAERREPVRPVEPPAPRLPFTMHPDYTFSRFVVGPTNRMAHAAAVSVSESPGKLGNPLFLHGASGLGKTHLLQAVCHSVLQKNPHARILYLTCEGFVNDFVRALQRRNTDEFRARYRDLDMLFVDDIHFLAGKTSSQEEFFHTFDALHCGAKQMVFSADAAPKHIRTLEERLLSRFTWGFVCRIDSPTFEMRLAILRQKAEEKNRVIPDDVITHIASRVQNNIRELEGAVTKILVAASLSQRQVDMELAREALDEIVVPHPRAPSPDQIIQTVAKHYGKKLSDFRSRRWTKSISLARQVAIYLCRHLTQLSLVEIGHAFGGKDHSTIMYSIHRIEMRSEADPDFLREIEDLARSIQI